MIAEIRKKFIDRVQNPAKYVNNSGPLEWGVEYIRIQPMAEALGLTRLGFGHYSEVYALSDTKVLKVVKERDEGYARFIEYTLKYPSPHFPKVYYRSNWAGHDVYVLERLNPAHDSLTAQALQNILYGMDSRRVRTSYPLAKTRPAKTGMFQWLHDIVNLCHDLKENGLVDDLHCENYMVRADGTFVITDPCS